MDYGCFLDRLEMELSAVAWHDVKEVAKHGGTSSGPTFHMIDASRCEVAGWPNKTSVSLAWRRTAGWLGDIARTANASKADAARLKVYHCQHPAHDALRATLEQLSGMQKLNDWRTTLR